MAEFVHIEGYERKQIHGTDPQFLIEKIIRERIYECVYWKEKLFAVNAADMVDRGADLDHIGGQYGNQRPTDFLACVLKLLQLQPEMEIVLVYLRNTDYKYLTALAAFYLRLIGTSVEVYQYLEPLLLDRRKLRFRKSDGTYEITFMDSFVDELLHEDRVCDTILPRLTKRFVLEDQGDLEIRVSPLEDEIDTIVEEEEEEEVPVEEEPEVKEIPLEDIDPLHKEKKKKWSNKKVKGLFKKEQKKKVIEEEPEEGDDKPPTGGFKDISLTFHESNILRANLGIAPLKAPLNIKK
jgi:pre-mRNA-splicing factor 38A